MFSIHLIFYSIVDSSNRTGLRLSFKVWHIPGLPFVVAAALVVVTIVVLEALHRLETSRDDDDDDDDDGDEEGTWSEAVNNRTEYSECVKLSCI